MSWIRAAGAGALSTGTCLLAVPNPWGNWRDLWIGVGVCLAAQFGWWIRGIDNTDS